MAKTTAIRWDQCFACTSRRCNYRIWTDAGDFDEVACREHGRDLEIHSDEILRGRARTHLTSTENLRRKTRKQTSIEPENP